MSSDWWTQASTSSPHSHPSFNTPVRPSHLSTSRARFAGDELDPEDAKMADGIRFLPSFASSPAGKLAMGQSPAATGTGTGMGMGMSVSPPVNRRSPTTRFTPGAVGESPRNARRMAGGTPQTITIDDDLPPTASLRDTEAPTPTRSYPSPPSLPTPPSLLPQANTTTLHVFGPPTTQLSELEGYFSQIGPVVSYKPGPNGSNWWVVEYQNPTAASYALRRHGEIINGRWMLGFKVAGPGSTAGCTLVEGGDGVVARGAGTPMRVQSAPIIRQKAVMQGNKGDDYAWEDGEKPVGWGNWVAEKLFGS